MDVQKIDAIFRQVSQPVWIVTASAQSEAESELDTETPSHGGLVATWVFQTSIDKENPRLMAGLAPNHYTYELIKQSQHFAVHLIDRLHTSLAWNFAIGSGRERDKLDDIPHHLSPNGCPILKDCLSWLECKVVTTFNGGDRMFLLAEVTSGEQVTEGEPLTEQGLIGAADPDQLEALKADLIHDIKLQRPVWNSWKKQLDQ